MVLAEKMNKLIVTIPITTDGAAAAERTCDLIYALHGNITSGHAVLVFDPEVHGELVKKVTIAAEVAFEVVETATAGRGSRNLNNNLFHAAAKAIIGGYRWPWLYLDAGCVPHSGEWRQSLVELYDAQPKRYLGSHLKSGETVFLSRASIYPPGAFADLEKSLTQDEPFETASAAFVVPRSTKTRAIQHGVFDSDDDAKNIRPDALIVCGDRTGAILERAFLEVKPAGRRVAVNKK